MVKKQINKLIFQGQKIAKGKKKNNQATKTKAKVFFPSVILFVNGM